MDWPAHLAGLVVVATRVLPLAGHHAGHVPGPAVSQPHQQLVAVTQLTHLQHICQGDQELVERLEPQEPE